MAQATLGDIIPGQMVLDGMRTQGKQAMENKPASSAPPRSLYKFLHPGSHLYLLPWLPYMMDRYLKV